MANMMDYIQWRGDLTFSERPFNEVDGLIFAELSYVDYSNIVPNTVVEGITLKRAAEEYFLKYPDSRGRLGIVVPDSIHDLLRAAGNSERLYRRDQRGEGGAVQRGHLHHRKQDTLHSLPGYRRHHSGLEGEFQHVLHVPRTGPERCGKLPEHGGGGLE